MEIKERKPFYRKKFGKKLKKKKKKTLRQKTKNSALTKGVNLKSRGDLIDYDYVHKLSEAEKKYLNDFTEGWTNADFRSDGTKDVFKDHEHIRKEAYRRNNYRNQDLYTKKKTMKSIISLEDFHSEKKTEEISIEDLIDIKRELDKGFKACLDAGFCKIANIAAFLLILSFFWIASSKAFDKD